jgi:hypothetical protein
MLDHISQIRSQHSPGPKPSHGPEAVDAQPLPDLPGVQAGIGLLFSDSQTMRPPGYPDDQFTNSWSVVSPELNLDVWAGARGPDPEQGFLLVVAWNADRTSIQWSREFDAPQRGGALHILSASAATLSVSDDEGHLFSFNVTTQAFAN